MKIIGVNDYDSLLAFRDKVFVEAGPVNIHEHALRLWVEGLCMTHDIRPIVDTTPITGSGSAGNMCLVSISYICIITSLK